MKYLNVLLCFSFVSLLTTYIFASQVETSNNCPTLFYSIISDDVDDVRVAETLLEYGADPDARLKNCPLHIVNEDRTRDPLHPGDLFSEESTLLHLAAYYNFYRMYDKLVEAGADEEIIDHQGFTPEQLKRHLRNHTFRMPVL